MTALCQVLSRTDWCSLGDFEHRLAVFSILLFCLKVYFIIFILSLIDVKNDANMVKIKQTEMAKRGEFSDYCIGKTW